MCGIIAIICEQPTDNLVAAEIHEALYLLQHRGQGKINVHLFGRLLTFGQMLVALQLVAPAVKSFNAKAMALQQKCSEMALEYRTCVDIWWALEFGYLKTLMLKCVGHWPPALPYCRYQRKRGSSSTSPYKNLHDG